MCTAPSLMDRFSVTAFALALLLGLAAAPQARAQDPAAYPNRPVRIIVPYAAGGLADTMTRIVAQRLAESFSQQVVVENRGGGGGIAGTDAVAKSTPDGYTLLFADTGPLAINPSLYPKLPYDPVRDFAPVSLIGSSSVFLIAHESVPVKSFADLVTLARAKPGQLNYGSAGAGSIHHLTMESLKAALGLDFVHVPYKGTGQMVPALVGGQVAIGFASLPSIASHIKAGRVKLLAINVLQRSPRAPEVPTIAELGVPGFDYPGHNGLVAPAGTPAAIIARLSAETARAVRHPDTVQRFNDIGLDPVGSTPEAFAAQMRADIEKYARAVKMSGARAD